MSARENLIRELALRSGVSNLAVEAVIKELGPALLAVLEVDPSISLVGVGAFRSVEIAKRRGRNPATGQWIEIPAYRRLVFRQSASMKRAVGNSRTR
jgi:nucleoid DNA-binding protein